MTRIFFTLALLSSCLINLIAQGSETIIGNWITPGEEAIIQIERTNGQFTGKILHLHPDAYANGEAPKDENNENLNLRSRSLEGITILSGITYDSKKETWMVKHIYVPKRGKSYTGYIQLQDAKTLRLRGHVPGNKWLGETEIWIRQED